LLRKLFLVASKEKLKIVIGAAEPRLGAGSLRRRRRQNAFELFSI
jgi:hypothetical protein